MGLSVVLCLLSCLSRIVGLICFVLGGMVLLGKFGICGIFVIVGMGGKCDLNCLNWDWNWDCSEV